MRDTELLLSFAIPTYNFAAYIEQTICSIFEGARVLQERQIEIVVVDGASTDNTEELMTRLMNRFPSIKYTKQVQRGGIDFDLNHAVSLAQAPFVWMFSADDVLQVGWDTAIAPLLERATVDVMLIPAMVCTLEMQPMRRNRIFSFPANEQHEVFDFSKPHTRSHYLDSAVTLEALFSYMSSVLVKRSTWLELPSSEAYFGSCWAHCARLMPLVSNQDSKAQIVYLNSFLIQKRTGNDSFMEHGLIRRIAITVDGWSQLIHDFYGDSGDAHKLNQLMARDASVLVFAYAKLGCKSAHETQTLVKLAQKAYGKRDLAWSYRMRYLFIRCLPAMPRVLYAIRGIVPQVIFWKHRLLGLLQR